MPTKRQGKLYKRTIDREEPDPIDVYVGKRIRRARSLCNMSQQELAKGFNVYAQQIQKYETGHNRVSASRLVMIAEALDISLMQLFGKYAGFHGNQHLKMAFFEGNSRGISGTAPVTFNIQCVIILLQLSRLFRRFFVEVW